MTAEQAFDQYHRAVYQFLYRLVGRRDLAEDITQDTFLVIVRDPKRWNQSRADTRTFLFGIARNLALKHYRDSRPNVEAVGEELAPPEGHSDQELPVLVAQVVARLPELQREALILFEYEGFQLNEIATIVGADVGAVKSRLHRARESMKLMLAPYKKVGVMQR